MQIAARECHSAADVRALNREIINRRRSSFSQPERLERASVPIIMLAPEPEIVPEPEPEAVQTPALPLPFGIIHQIQDAVCKTWGVTRKQLLGAGRDIESVMPRHAAMVICLELTPRSLGDIGRHNGNRDHTCVLNALRRLRVYTNSALAKMPEDPTPLMWAQALHREINFIGRVHDGRRNNRIHRRAKNGQSI